MPVASDITLALRLVRGGGERNETELRIRTSGYLPGKRLPAFTILIVLLCSRSVPETYEYTKHVCIPDCLLRFPKSHSYSDHRIY